MRINPVPNNYNLAKRTQIVVAFTKSCDLRYRGRIPSDIFFCGGQVFKSNNCFNKTKAHIHTYDVKHMYGMMITIIRFKQYNIILQRHLEEKKRTKNTTSCETDKKFIEPKKT